METFYTINDLISWREIQGEILILDSQKNQMAHELNPIGSFIFQHIAQGASLPETLNLLIKNFENIPPEEIEKDFYEYIDKLQELGLILPKK